MINYLRYLKCRILRHKLCEKKTTVYPYLFGAHKFCDACNTWVQIREISYEEFRRWMKTGDKK